MITTAEVRFDKILSEGLKAYVNIFLCYFLIIMLGRLTYSIYCCIKKPPFSLRLTKFPKGLFPIRCLVFPRLITKNAHPYTPLFHSR